MRGGENKIDIYNKFPKGTKIDDNSVGESTQLEESEIVKHLSDKYIPSDLGINERLLYYMENKDELLKSFLINLIIKICVENKCKISDLGESITFKILNVEQQQFSHTIDLNSDLNSDTISKYLKSIDLNNDEIINFIIIHIFNPSHEN